MSEQNNAETQPSSPVPTQEADNHPAVGPKRKKSGMWIVWGLLAIILVAGAGGLGGYFAGITDRKAVEKNQREIETSTQFLLGMADMQAGRYTFAKQRFEYVIQLDPSYPGVLENMAKLTIIMNATATPEVMPTFTPAPTMDLSGVEAMLVQTKQLLVASDWNGAIQLLDNLRKENVTFKTLEVDGLYYLALRNRGMQKIVNGNLEGGIYDFAVMKRFGPQDKDSKDQQEWAVMYLQAARYFGWDWEKAVMYLGEVYQYIPTLMDSSHRTVADRYRESLGKYADVLSGKEKWCDAYPYYDQSLAIGNDNAFAEARTKAYNKCQASLPTATPTIDPSSIVTEEPPAPTEETVIPEEPTAESTLEGTGG